MLCFSCEYPKNQNCFETRMIALLLSPEDAELVYQGIRCSKQLLSCTLLHIKSCIIEIFCDACCKLFIILCDGNSSNRTMEDRWTKTILLKRVLCRAYQLPTNTYFHNGMLQWLCIDFVWWSGVGGSSMAPNCGKSIFLPVTMRSISPELFNTMENNSIFRAHLCLLGLWTFHAYIHIPIILVYRKDHNVWLCTVYLNKVHAVTSPSKSTFRR